MTTKVFFMPISPGGAAYPRLRPAPISMTCSWRRNVSAQPREQRSENINAVPQILQPQVLVGGMLIVVVVGDGYADYRRVLLPFKQVHGHAAAQADNLDYRPAGRLLNGAHHRLGQGI